MLKIFISERKNVLLVIGNNNERKNHIRSTHFHSACI